MVAPILFGWLHSTKIPFDMKKSLLAFVFSLGCLLAAGQEGEPTNALHSTEPAETFKHFRASLLIGHTYVPTGEEPKHLFVPSWGLDLEYWFNRRWGLGLHNDLELQTFIVEKQEGEQLEREYPLVTTLDVLVKPFKDLVLLIGPGYEFEKKENFALLRAGIEYEFEFGKDWDISPTIFYDTRFDAFDTWSFAVGIGKRF